MLSHPVLHNAYLFHYMQIHINFCFSLISECIRECTKIQLAHPYYQ